MQQKESVTDTALFGMEAVYNSPMDTTKLIEALDLEIARLQHARALLSGAPLRGKPGPKPKAVKRTMSAEGRARVAAAQKARWAKTHGK
jgi:hypothetical protein